MFKLHDAHYIVATFTVPCYSVLLCCVCCICALNAAVTAAAAAATLCRPVPLQMSFVGVTVTNMTARNNMMNQICYDKVRHSCGPHPTAR
jgi:hypothetical protein